MLKILMKPKMMEHILLFFSFERENMSRGHNCCRSDGGWKCVEEKREQGWKFSSIKWGKQQKYLHQYCCQSTKRCEQHLKLLTCDLRACSPYGPMKSAIVVLQEEANIKKNLLMTIICIHRLEIIWGLLWCLSSQFQQTWIYQLMAWRLWWFLGTLVAGYLI